MCLNVKLVKHVGAVCNRESESECSLASPVSTKALHPTKNLSDVWLRWKRSMNCAGCSDKGS